MTRFKKMRTQIDPEDETIVCNKNIQENNTQRNRRKPFLKLKKT
jgi:hypothetical protein